MEPLAEENTKLKEAVKLMEKNVQRAQHERDLAESNAWDLEYQKGALSEQLVTMSKRLQGSFEQLEHSSEQLRSLFEQKKGTVDLWTSSVLPNNFNVAYDRHFCRARCRAWPVASGHRSTLGGEGEGIWASGEIGQGAKR